jgi:hypothetical protein
VGRHGKEDHSDLIIFLLLKEHVDIKELDCTLF